MEKQEVTSLSSLSNLTHVGGNLDLSPDRMQKLFVKVAAKLQTKADELAKELVGNFPEYGSEEWVSCTDYDYEKGEFTFRVEDPDQEGRYHTHVVTTSELAKSIPLFWLAVTAGECNPHALTCNGGQDFWDAGNWDQPAVDCLLQYHFYGECVFG